MWGAPAVCQELYEKLNLIQGVEAQQMVFGHPGG